MTAFNRLYEKLGIPEDHDESRGMDEVLKAGLEQMKREEADREVQKQGIHYLQKLIKKNKEISEEECLAELEKLEHFKAEQLREKENKKLAPQIGQSVLASAFIAYPFIMISMREWKGLWFSVMIALCAVLYLTISWQSFVKDYKKSRETVKEGLKSTARSTAWIIGIMFVVVFLMIGIEKLQKIFFVPEDYILYQFDRPYLYGVFFMEAELLVLFFLKGVLKHSMVRSKRKRVAVCISAAILNLFLFFAAVTGVTVCTPTGVTRHTFYDLKGTTYAYKSVAQIDAGFKKKGEFYYKLKMKDGTTIQIDDSISNQFEVTYEEYLALDQLIMKYKPIKETSTRYIGNASLDTQYLEILKKALNNK